MTAIDTARQQTTSAIAGQTRQNQRYLWILNRTVLARGPGCGLDYTGSTACDLVAAPVMPTPLQSLKPTSSTAPDVCEAAGLPKGPPPPAAPAAKPLAPADLFKALDTYTAALAAVTNAKDRANFDTAAAKVSTAVGSLAQSAGPEGAAAAPIAKASLNLALWLVGEGLDYQRLEQLRIATQAACEPIHVLAGAATVVLEQQRGLRLSGLDEWLNYMIQALNRARAAHASDDAYGNAIDNAQAAAVAFEAERVTDPQKIMQAFSDAHDALVVAVRNNDGQFATLVANLQTLAQQAQTLAAAVTPPAATKKSS